MIPDLLERFDTIYRLSNECQNRLLTALERHTVDKKAYLLKARGTSQRLYFVHKGLLRGYIERGDKEFNTDLMTEGGICFVPDGYFRGKPSTVNIQALEYSVLYSLHVNEVKELCRDYPEFHFIIGHYLQRWALGIYDCHMVFRLYDMEGRYKWFQETYPQLMNKLTGNVLGSYLGMTPVFLSRITTGRKKTSKR